MNRIFFLFFLSFSFLSFKKSLAQTKSDSLLKITQSPHKDSSVAIAFNGLANLFIYTDINTAWKYSDSALALARKLALPKEIAEALNTKGVININRNEYAKAFACLNAAYKIFTALHNKAGQARIQSNIGIIYDLQGEYDTALVYYKKTLTLNTELGNQRGIGYSNNNIGAIYHNQGNLPEALNFYLKGLKARELAGDATGISGSFTNIGLVYSSLGEFDKALVYFQKAIELVEKNKNKLTAATLYSEIGLCYNKKKKFDLAEQFYRKALRLSVENGDKYAITLNLNCLGENFYALNKLDSATRYYVAAYDTAALINSKVDMAIVLHNMGMLLFLQNKFKEALSRNFESEKIANEINDLVLLSGIYEAESNCYEKLNNPEKALTSYKKYISYRDSVFNEENTKKNVRTEMNFEFDKKEAIGKAEQEKKEAVAAAEKRKQQIVLFLVCCVLILVLVFAVFAYRSFLQKKKANIEISKQKHIIEEKQKEILDSIYYARRIQCSLLPTEKYIDRIIRKFQS